MLPWLMLGVAILIEVGGTLCLRAAVNDRPRLYPLVLSCYIASFLLLTRILEAGIPLGITYGIWASCGVALTAIASRFLFGERLTATMAGGIGLIAVGVFLVELGSTH